MYEVFTAWYVLLSMHWHLAGTDTLTDAASLTPVDTLTLRQSDTAERAHNDRQWYD